MSGKEGNMMRNFLGERDLHTVMEEVQGQIKTHKNTVKRFSCNRKTGGVRGQMVNVGWRGVLSPPLEG